MNEFYPSDSLFLHSCFCLDDFKFSPVIVEELKKDKVTADDANLGYVHTKPDKFENATFSAGSLDRLSG